jgi:hypothetical protein
MTSWGKREGEAALSFGMTGPGTQALHLYMWDPRGFHAKMMTGARRAALARSPGPEGLGPKA